MEEEALCWAMGEGRAWLGVGRRPRGCRWRHAWSSQTPQKGAGLRWAESEMQCTLTMSPVWHSSPGNCTSPPLAPLSPQNPQEAILCGFYKACPVPAEGLGTWQWDLGFGQEDASATTTFPLTLFSLLHLGLPPSFASFHRTMWSVHVLKQRSSIGSIA